MLAATETMQPVPHAYRQIHFQYQNIKEVHKSDAHAFKTHALILGLFRELQISMQEVVTSKLYNRSTHYCGHVLLRTLRAACAC